MTMSLSQKFPQFESFMVIISFKDIRKYEQSVTEWEASTLSANAPDFTDGEALLNNLHFLTLRPG
ncbi:MAG: hypothetical protein YK1309IOTA_760004 [Marine Group I thaumarchaeote]|nr:MAG: hypothetical protein NPMRIOTA_330006 [Nitrosopumilales archaeon]GFN39733.1 MAG: hypothetical protein YK1309IOTA_760004 [Marine Group I thaumarchaeote]